MQGAQVDARDADEPVRHGGEEDLHAGDTVAGDDADAAHHQMCIRDRLLGELEPHGVRIINFNKLSNDEAALLELSLIHI